ncbi:MAG: S-layer homology domain-containing protein, partial [Candidatus Peregrinibacteria bacterium]
QKEKRNVTELEGLYSKLKACVEGLVGLASGSGSDPQDFWEANMDCDDLERDFWDLSQDMHSQSQSKELPRAIKDVTQRIEKMERECGRVECTAEMKNLISRMKELQKEIQRAGDKGDYQGFWDLYNDFNFESEKFWEELQGVHESMEGDFGFEDMEAFENFGDIQMAPEAFRGEMMQLKESMMKEIGELESLTNRLREAKKIAQQELQELQAVQDEIGNYNFLGNAGEGIKKELREFVSQAEALSKSQVKMKVQELKTKAREKIQEAKEEKFQKGVIAFVDADDNDWFGFYALRAKEAGLVKGTGESGGKELNPNGLTNVAEACALFGRVIGVDETVQPSSAVGRRMPDWAKAGCAALEMNGVNLDDVFGAKQAGDTVTRAEAARLLEAVFDLPAGQASFPDINRASTAEKEAIGAVNAAGIMTGEGSGQFNVKGPLNRAAMVKVLIKAQGLNEVNPLPTPHENPEGSVEINPLPTP